MFYHKRIEKSSIYSIIIMMFTTDAFRGRLKVKFCFINSIMTFMRTKISLNKYLTRYNQSESQFNGSSFSSVNVDNGKKPTFPNSNSILNARAFLNEFFELLGAPWVNKLHLHFFYIFTLNIIFT